MMEDKTDLELIQELIKRKVGSIDNLKMALLIPEPFHDAWTGLISLCEDMKAFEDKLKGNPRWPIIALGIKAAHTTQAIATLAAMRQWSDALILGRSLFETEIIVKWLLQDDIDNRVQEYLSEVLTEEKRLLRKIVDSKSVTAQIIRDVYWHENFLLNNIEKTEVKKKSKISVRELARQTSVERSYDVSYWIQSMICHSHALSISQWNQGLIDIKSPFVDFFGFKDKALPSWMVLESLPANALDTIQLVNHHFELGLNEKINGVREMFRLVVARVSKNKVEFTSEIERGDMKVTFENGEVRHYRSNKNGNDPLDNLL